VQTTYVQATAFGEDADNEPRVVTDAEIEMQRAFAAWDRAHREWTYSTHRIPDYAALARANELWLVAHEAFLAFIHPAS